MPEAVDDFNTKPVPKPPAPVTTKVQLGASSNNTLAYIAKAVNATPAQISITAVRALSSGCVLTVVIQR